MREWAKIELKKNQELLKNKERPKYSITHNGVLAGQKRLILTQEDINAFFPSILP
ncbi:MAG: hypothetical protein CM15mP10_1030 [Actinomycetota bacterium]|nr:MAG: hypothetical protein CM15mP10_1030 [Actinomycetota bacterium]